MLEKRKRETRSFWPRVFSLIVIVLFGFGAGFFIVKNLYPHFQTEERHGAPLASPDAPSLNLNHVIASIDAGTTVPEGSDDYKVVPVSSEVSGDLTYEKQKAARKKGSLAIIVDDIGYDLAGAKKLAALKIPLTWAIIPKSGHSGASATLARLEKIPFIVHMPMQAITDGDEGNFAVAVGFPEETIRQRTLEAVRGLPGAVGVNNHRGSKATTDRRAMSIFMDTIKKERPDWFFVDSHTIGGSVAYRVATEKGISAAVNNVFMDNKSDQTKIEEAFRLAAKRASTKGSCIAICHLRPQTLIFLKRLSDGEVSVPEGVTLVTMPQFLGK